MSGTALTDVPKEGKPVCMVAGVGGGSAEMLMIFQERCLPKKSSCSQTSGDIMISSDSSRYITIEVQESDDQGS